MEISSIEQEKIEKTVEALQIKIYREESIKETQCNELKLKTYKRNVLDKKYVLNGLVKEAFKKPVSIIGPQKVYRTKVKNIPDNILNETLENKRYQLNKNGNNIINLVNKSNKSQFILENEKELSFSYIEPLWSGKFQDIYKLEVLTSGTISEIIDLSNRNYHVIGRLPTCNISMAHPTVSRYHAILQFREIEDEENKKGIYVYDLGSTHGTFCNGKRIQPKLYVRLQGGHIIKFGCSQRKFIVQAPLNDQESESEYSVTELKEIRRLELQKKENSQEQKLLKKEVNKKLIKAKQETQGIDWGMSEDADEETDLTENPYAETNNEELFLEDPKKTLRGWFEREGYDLQYQTEDKGLGKFLCYIDLPVDHSTKRKIRAEAVITGKKKEAVVQCALEACRILDRHGLLRQANHETRKKKSRNWEEEDYYDSDEDNFLDRTGIIERKREQRMRLAGKLDSGVETYVSLLEKYTKVTEKITCIENTIALQKLKQSETDDSNTDALDAYMSTLQSSALNKIEIREIKMKLLNLRKEEKQLLKLINIAKPANLPSLKPYNLSMVKELKDDFKNLKSVIGQNKKFKSSTKQCEATSKLIEENLKINKYKKQIVVDTVKGKLAEFKQENELDKQKINNEKNEVTYFKSKNIVIVKALENNMNKCIEGNKNIEKDNLNKNQKNIDHIQQKKSILSKVQTGYDGDEFRENYSMWLPPENQCGDGKTNLNEKFGY